MNAFCPTGEGGGVDPTCGAGGSGGGSIADRVQEHLSKPRGTIHTATPEAVQEERDSADKLMAEIERMPSGKVMQLAKGMGIEGIGASSSKSAMLGRIKNRLTALGRAKERSEV